MFIRAFFIIVKSRKNPNVPQKENKYINCESLYNGIPQGNTKNKLSFIQEPGLILAIMLNKRIQTQVILIYLSFKNRFKRLVCVDRSQNSSHLFQGWGTNYKKARRAFWGVGNILFLYLDSGYTGVYICKI